MANSPSLLTAETLAECSSKNLKNNAMCQKKNQPFFEIFHISTFLKDHKAYFHEA